MDDDKQTHTPDETIPERVRRVAGHALPAGPKPSWAPIISALLILLLILGGLGLAIGFGAHKMLGKHFDRVREAADEAADQPE